MQFILYIEIRYKKLGEEPPEYRAQASFEVDIRVERRRAQMFTQMLHVIYWYQLVMEAFHLLTQIG